MPRWSLLTVTFFLECVRARLSTSVPTKQEKVEAILRSSLNLSFADTAASIIAALEEK